jgi:hypothetical protein
MSARSTICRQCADQPLRSGTAGSEAAVRQRDRRSMHKRAQIVKASGKAQVSGQLDGLRQSLSGTKVHLFPLACVSVDLVNGGEPLLPYLTLASVFRYLPAAQS